MDKTEYINVTVGKDVYKVPSVEYPQDADGLSVMVAILIKLHQRVEELEDDLYTARRVGKDCLEAQKEARNDALREEVQVRELRAKLAWAVEALDEALYFLQPDERDMAKRAGKYRIVKAYEGITGQKYQVDDDKEKNDGS